MTNFIKFYSFRVSQIQTILGCTRVKSNFAEVYRWTLTLVFLDYKSH